MSKMIAVESKVYLWEDLLHAIGDLLSKVDESCSEAKTDWSEKTPEFDRVEDMVSDIYDFVQGHIQELDPEYSERTAWGDKAKAQARKALSYGINFQAFKGVPFDETDKALAYIEEHGLASMNYEATREALRTYRKTALA